jgi:hypothetical protein
MGRTFHEFGVPRKGFLEMRKLIQKPAINPQGCRVPPRVRKKPIVKQVEAAQILDLEMARKGVVQFSRGKEMKADRKTTAAMELDLASVAVVIMLEIARLVD